MKHPILALADIPFPAFNLDQTGKLMGMNQPLLSLSGYLSEEVSLLPIEQLIPACPMSESRAYWLTLSQHSKQLASPVVSIQTKAQKHLLFSARVSRVDEQFVVFLHQRQQVNDQDHYLSLTGQLTHCGHWSYIVAQEHMFWSEDTYKIFDLNPDKFQPSLSKLLNLFRDADRIKFKNHLELALNKAQAFYFKDCITLTSGRKIKIELQVEVELDSKDKVSRVFGVIHDITLISDTQERLKLLGLVNYTIQVPIFFIDDNDNVVYQDLSPQQEIEKSVLFNYVNFSIAEYMALKNQAKTAGQIKQCNVSFDKFISIFDLSITYASTEGIYIWIIEDVTEQYRQQQQQIISNRIALLGNTFGNVSHDINNVLGVALGSIEMLEMKYAQGDLDISKYINRVKNAIDKGSSVTERLLAFTRKPTVKVVEFDPIKEIKDNQYLFNQLLLTSINLTFNFKFDGSHCLINFPQGEFINIILNIVLNAQDAIQEKGLSGKIVIDIDIEGRNRLTIQIKDSGVGIEDKNLSRIFDPFYSSKSLNKGNGIGLANVYSTMYKHNGEIRVQGTSDLGGAHFTLLFKCYFKDPYKAVVVGQDKTLNIKNKHILILDDEVSISEFVALYLEGQGAVTTYINNKEQLLALLGEQKHYDIFITDMLMPDLTGREAVSLVKANNPAVKIYSISGYVAVEDKTWQYPILRKPFNSKDLANFLRD